MNHAEFGYIESMRLLICIVVISVGVLLATCTTPSVDGDERTISSSSGPAAGDRQPVLVELFTSEGCSSCPPADKALAFLENQQPVTKAEIITLAFHVDYWDRLGWKDRFSSPLYSRRQEIYSQAFKLDSNYTPQMVVDGRFEFVGNDTGKATREILRSAEQSKAGVDVAVDKNSVTVKIGDAPSHTDATVYAAIAEDGISTRVERGENTGKTLEHVSVVRELRTLGVLSSDKSTFEAGVDVTPPPDAKAENLKIVIFVQENESRRIIGVAKAKWAGTQLKAER